jgi:hypothetical protein
VKLLTWQNPEQLFVAQELKKYFKLNAAELRITLRSRKNDFFR